MRTSKSAIRAFSILMLAVFAIAWSWGNALEATAQDHPSSPEAHAKKPKRLEAIIQINMGEMYFANHLGAKGPVFEVSAGKTIGIHVHNEGAVMHELMIGRGMNEGDEHGYKENLFQMVPSDLFFYYGDKKVELEEALFEELEVDPGIRDIWIRIKIPENLRGEWEIGCFVEGHYEAGMFAKLIIK